MVANNDYDICMIVHNAMLRDTRVQKEAKSLQKHGWRVLVLALTRSGSTLPLEETFDGVDLKRVTVPIWYEKLPFAHIHMFHVLASLIVIIIRGVFAIKETRARVYHAHDFSGLMQLAFTGLRNKTVVYDSHELYFDRCSGDVPCSLTDRMMIYLRPLEKRYVKHVSGVITVNDSIADILAETLSISRPIVVRNAVDIRQEGIQEREFPAEEGVKYIVHTGNITKGRNLTNLIEAISLLSDDYGLILLGDGSLKHELLDHAKQRGILHRFYIFPFVAPENVSSTIAQADAAAILLYSHEVLNYHYALPNKLFEAIAAALPLIASPAPDIARIVETNDIGKVCDPTDAQSIADAIKHILDPQWYQHYKSNAVSARETLNWEREEQKLITLYQTLLK